MKGAMSGITANVLVVVHVFVALFALFGGLLVFADLRWVWIHLPVAIWMIAVNLADLTCPLTVWEKAARGGRAYEGGFIDRYFASSLNVGARRLERWVGGTILIANAAVYAAAAGHYRGTP